MSFDAIVGGQWGDEGKGKIVDLLSKNVDVVARYRGCKCWTYCLS